MAAYSIIKKSELEGAKRLDAEYYCSPRLLSGANYYTGADIASFVQYGTSEELNEEGRGYPVLRLNEFEGYFSGIPSKHSDKLNEKQFEELRLKIGDVVITRTNGNPALVGKSTVVMKDDGFAFASYLFRVRTDKSKITPATLVTFLDSKFGRSEIEKYLMPSIQSNFSPAKFREIKIPKFPSVLQNEIDEIFDTSYFELQNSKSLYSQAENLLLEELGLKDFKEEQSLFSVVNLSELKEANRMDAEYFQQKYELVNKHIEGKKYSTLGEMSAFVGHATQAPYDEHGSIAVLAQKHMKRDLQIDVDGFDNFTTDDLIKKNDKKYILKKGDILISSAGEPGLTSVWTEDYKAKVIPGSFVTVARLKDNIEPLYVGVFLNTPAGKLQFERNYTGSIQQYVYPVKMKKVLIPILPKVAQEKIAGLVKQSHEARKRAKELLESAKRKVEEMIERKG